jgi:hypothetical protein
LSLDGGQDALGVGKLGVGPDVLDLGLSARCGDLLLLLLTPRPEPVAACSR